MNPRHWPKLYRAQVIVSGMFCIPIAILLFTPWPAVGSDDETGRIGLMFMLGIPVWLPAWRWKLPADWGKGTYRDGWLIR